VCAFLDKYQLIGTLVSECSCHSNVNAAAGGGADGGDAPASEGINTAAAAPPQSGPSGICALV